MATYKVIQDIEAEDKLVGPLTLRQFIYAGVTAVCLYLCFIALTKHVYFLIGLFLPPGVLTGFFAFPFGRDQPTEVWALAKIRFMLKPRRRVWNQSGIKELVTVTAPKKIEVNYTDGLSQTEVRSRLRALADTIDSRGWAVKNSINGAYSPPGIGMVNQDSDRLIDIGSIPQEVNVNVSNADDMLDDQNSVSQQFESMIERSDQAHRQHIMQAMSQAQTNNPSPQGPPSMSTGPQLPAPQLPSNQRSNGASTNPPADYWFMSQSPATPGTHAQVIAPSSASSGPVQTVQPGANAAADENDEKALSDRLRKQNNSQGISYAHLHTILPLSEQKALAEKAAREAAAAQAQQTPVTQPPDPAIMALASNNDLNVATIARQAKKDQEEESPDEVVISLH